MNGSEELTEGEERGEMVSGWAELGHRMGIGGQRRGDRAPAGPGASARSACVVPGLGGGAARTAQRTRLRALFSRLEMGHGQCLTRRDVTAVQGSGQR